MIETAPGATSPFYTMPYVEGESLRSRLRRERQLSLDEALRLAGDVASALAYAHGRGVVHRDVKPENILLSNGQAVVADFGIARAVSLAGGDRLTSTGLALGTPHYMSPEQTAGDPEVDARADVCPGRRRPVADRAGAAGPALSAERLRGGRSGHRACAGQSASSCSGIATQAERKQIPGFQPGPPVSAATNATARFVAGAFRPSWQNGSMTTFRTSTASALIGSPPGARA